LFPLQGKSGLFHDSSESYMLERQSFDLFHAWSLGEPLVLISKQKSRVFSDSDKCSLKFGCSETRQRLTWSGRVKKAVGCKSHLHGWAE
jgi:hypothetical protein